MNTNRFKFKVLGSLIPYNFALFFYYKRICSLIVLIHFVVVRKADDAPQCTYCNSSERECNFLSNRDFSWFILAIPQSRFVCIYMFYITGVHTWARKYSPFSREKLCRRVDQFFLRFSKTFFSIFEISHWLFKVTPS